MKVLVAALVALAGCAERGGPDVVVELAADTPELERHYIEAGANAWHELGFELVDESALPECPHLWYQRDEIDCAIHAVVVREPIVVGDMEYAGATDRGARRIILSTRLTTDSYDHKLELWAVAAHEFGHLLLNTSTHLPDGVGVMSSPPHGFDPTDADYELACSAIGVCP